MYNCKTCGRWKRLKRKFFTRTKEFNIGECDLFWFTSPKHSCCRHTDIKESCPETCSCPVKRI